METYNIEDVFTYKSPPRYTYIDRVISFNETYESKLKQALLTDEKLIFILGAYKSGKTTLYQQVVPTSKLVNIIGTYISTEEDFWQQIAIREGLYFEANDRNITIANKTLAESKCHFIIRHLISHNKILVIDDFHHINPKLQASIITILKQELLSAIKIVIISVIHKTDSILRSLPLYMTTIYIMPWKSKELEEIAYKGFSLIKMHLTEYSINLLTRESVACPQLMQENCYKLAIFAREQNLREVNDETARRIIPYMKYIKFI